MRQTTPLQRRRLHAAWRPPQGTVQVGGALAVRVLGSGEPILLLHGLLGTNRYWSGHFDRLADRGSLLAPDLLGFGNSRRPPSGYGPDAHGGAVLALLREQQVTMPLLVVGHSLGALLAMWLACHHSDRVKGVVAFSPPIYRDPQHARQRMGNLGLMERIFASEHPAAIRVASMACRQLCSGRPRLAAALYSMFRPDVPHPLLKDATLHSWASYSETMMHVILAAECAKWLPAARVPILVVAGSRDRYLDLELLHELLDGCPQRRLEVWRGEGHDLPLNQPERCLSAIERLR